MCAECTRRRDDAARLRAMKGEWPAPVYDWPALESADRRSREDPEWYKKGRTA